MASVQRMILRFLERLGFRLRWDGLVFLLGSGSLVSTSSPVSSSKSRAFRGSRKSSLISAVDFSVVAGEAVGSAVLVICGSLRLAGTALREGTKSSGRMDSAAGAVVERLGRSGELGAVVTRSLVLRLVLRGLATGVKPSALAEAMFF